MSGKEDGQRVFWIVPVLLLTTVLFTPRADAWRGDHDHDRYQHRRHYDHHHHRHFFHERPVIVWPGKYITIAIGGGRERSYRRHRDYVVVREPIGVIISSIPSGCHRFRIDGRDYYTYNDVYYLKVAGGYRVVEQPSQVIVALDTVSNDSIGGPLTVNIPNSNGGYTAVTLKRSGTGFIGPQGEFYPEFPTVEQLRAMYGK
jgi:hypothetical protein